MENNKKSREEQYLEELYKAIDTGEVPEGMVPPQLTSLQKSGYEFRKINVPGKRKMTVPERLTATGRALSFVYLLVGVIVLLATLSEERIPISGIFSPQTYSSNGEEMFGLLFWVFLLGTMTSAVSAAAMLAPSHRKHNGRTAFVAVLFVLCLFFTIIVKNI